LSYRFESEDLPPVRLKLKVEINMREHFTVYGLKTHRFEVACRWFSGAADLRTYELDELLGTKLRALYQRKKGRDLFDLAHALMHNSVSPGRIVEVFKRYMAESGATISRLVLEQNLYSKRFDPVFTADMSPLLASGHAWSFDDAFKLVLRRADWSAPGGAVARAACSLTARQTRRSTMGLIELGCHAFPAGCSTYRFCARRS
jgi:hypothetical protein